MWTRVKYRLDGQVLNRPLTFFKDYSVVEDELKKREVRSEYFVFWSPTEGETPEDLLSKEKQLLQIDTIVWSLEKDLVAGYYKATLLNYAENEESLLKLLATPQGRRPPKVNIKPTQKGNALAEKRRLHANSKAAHNLTRKKFCSGEESVVPPLSENSKSNLESASQSQSFAPKCNVSKGNEEELAVKTTKENEEELAVKSKQVVRSRRGSKSASKEQPESDTEESCSDEDDVPYAQHLDLAKKFKELKSKFGVVTALNSELRDALVEEREKVRSCAEKCNSLEEKFQSATEKCNLLEGKIDNLEREVKELTSLNKYWQNEEIKRKSRPKHSSRHSSSSSKISSSRSHHSHESRTPPPARKELLTSKGTSASIKDHASPKRKHTPVSSRCVSPSFDDLLNEENDFPNSSEDKLEEDGVRVLLPEAGPSHAKEAETLSIPPSVEKSIPNVTSKPPTVLPQVAAPQAPTPPAKQTSKTKESSKKEIMKPQFTAEQITEYVERDDESPAFDIPLNCDSGKALTWAQFKVCRTQGLKKKFGESGDPMFIKNVAGCLWTAEELVARSAAGRASTTSKSEGRPECTPTKKKYCAELLKKKIFLEEREVFEEDFQKRTSAVKIIRYLGEKIKAARRSAGLKEDEN